MSNHEKLIGIGFSPAGSDVVEVELVDPETLQTVGQPTTLSKKDFFRRDSNSNLSKDLSDGGRKNELQKGLA